MVEGELLPTLNEQKHGTIPITIFMLSGKVEDKEVRVSHGFNGNIYIDYEGRTVKYSMEKMVTEAIEIIQKVK